MNKTNLAPVLGVIWLSILGISSDVLSKTVHFESESSETIEITNDTLFPEGITYNPISKRFVLGSFRQGAIYEIDEKGNANKIIEDDRLHSVFAVRIGVSHNKLFALTSDIGASVRTNPKAIKRKAALAIYDLSSGQNLSYVDLSKLVPDSEHLVNGMALDEDGNAYITDSFAAAIYKVDVKGKASLFLQSEEFMGKGINLNGIIYHPDGYLMTVKKSNGLLYKIPVNQPEKFKVVKTDDKFFGADGLILAENNNVVIIANRVPGHNTDSAFAVHSDDNWLTMETTGQYLFGDVYPTTGVFKDGNLYAVHTKLNQLILAPQKDKKILRQTATIEKIGYLGSNK